VTLPQSGWWASKVADQQVTWLALWPRPPRLALGATIGGGEDSWGWSGPPAETFRGEIPTPPTLEELIEDMGARIQATVVKSAVARPALTQPPPVTAVQAGLLHPSNGGTARLPSSDLRTAGQEQARGRVQLQCR
jgi:hypothetical protein